MGPRGLKTIPRGCGGSHSENGVSFRSIGKKYDAIFGQNGRKTAIFEKKSKILSKNIKEKGVLQGFRWVN